MAYAAAYGTLHAFITPVNLVTEHTVPRVGRRGTSNAPRTVFTSIAPYAAYATDTVCTVYAVYAVYTVHVYT